MKSRLKANVMRALNTGRSPNSRLKSRLRGSALEIRGLMYAIENRIEVATNKMAAVRKMTVATKWDPVKQVTLGSIWRVRLLALDSYEHSILLAYDTKKHSKGWRVEINE
jgi:hypothetical protein